MDDRKGRILEVELVWRWVLRGLLGLALVLLNVLLAILIMNVPGVFDSVDELGNTAVSVRAAAGALEETAASVEEMADAMSGTVEVVEETVVGVGEDVDEAAASLGEAGDALGRIADAFDEAFRRLDGGGSR